MSADKIACTVCGVYVMAGMVSRHEGSKKCAEYKRRNEAIKIW